MKTTNLAKKLIITNICFALLSFGCALAKESETAEGVERIDLGEVAPAAISSAAIEQGLSVIYYKNYSARNLSKLPADQSDEYPSFQGQPIVELNHQFGKEQVFGSGTSRLVGMRMKGYLNFSKPGVYEFQALSNDGVTVNVAGKTMLNDPDQHSDRLSNICMLIVKTPGWYPVVIEYFQRKGTASLILFWKEPGRKDFVPIPKEIYGHVP